MRFGSATDLGELAVVRGEVREDYDRVLTPAAVGFVTQLAVEFGPALESLLAERRGRRSGVRGLEFPPETTAVRDGEWKVAPIPLDLTRRIVEITGPVDRKMVINALNSGADC